MISALNKIYQLLMPRERKTAMLLLVLMGIGMALETLGIGLVIPAIMLMTQEDLPGKYPQLKPWLDMLGNNDQRTLIIGGMIALASVYLVKALFLAFLAWRQMSFAFGVQVQLSQRLFSNYLRQPYTFHLQRNSAQLIHNVITEVNLLVATGILPGMMFLTEGLVLLGISILLLIVEPVGAMIIVIVLGLAGWGFHRVTRNYISRWGKERQYHEGSRLQHLQQGLGSAKDVKLLGREDDFLRQYHVHNSQSAWATQYQSTLKQLPRLWLELLAVSGLAILVIVMLVLDRELSAIVPLLGVFAASAFRLIPAVNRLLSTVQSLRYVQPVIDTLSNEFKNSVPENVVVHTPTDPFQHEITLEHVCYSYPGETPSPALNRVSLTIHRGESVGFIGESGAGKSTLVDIILGLLTPSEGHVLADGDDISDNLRNWQNQIGYVPQSIYLTDDTLRRNVAFGLAEEQIDDTAVLRAIRAAQLEEFVNNSLPEGISTLVGERGIRLSGGQRQRIGIARALYHDPGILVLDEATSALDTVTEKGVMKAITDLHGKKTLIIIAHRYSTIEHCDLIFKLEHGQIVRSGTLAEIILSKKITT